MMASIRSYLMRLMDSTDRTAAVHDAMYLVGCAFFIVWLNHGIFKGKGFESGWNQAALTFAGLIGAGKIFGAFSDRPVKKDGDQ